MTLPIVGAGQQLGDGNTTEPLKVGVTGGRVGFFGSLGTTQIAALNTTVLAVIDTTTAAALSTSVLAGLTSSQINALGYHTLVSYASLANSLKSLGITA